MASSKTGIALLSMYDDEEDDDMEEDLNEQEEEEEQQEQRGEDEEMEEDEVRKEYFVDSGATTQVTEETVTIETSKFVSVTSGEVRIDSSSSLTVERRSRTAIVDYGHDEVAMSPEAEDAERPSMDVELSTTNGDFQEEVLGDQPNPQLSEQFDTTQNVTTNVAIRELEVTEGEDGLEIDDTGPKDVDPFDGFLPSPPQERCSDKLQDKINKFLYLKKSGKSYNAEVRNKKDYRNPDFLLHAVTYQDIDQIGSCFSKDVFDPHGYDKSDYYDEIEADYKLVLERKEQERKKTPKVEFSSAGMQPGTGFTAPRVGAPSPVPPVAPPTADIGREGRNKKSKWDKIDGDRSSSLPVGQDSKHNYGVHSAVLSSAAGSGYTAFAQQKRREAEEKRSSDRRRS